MISKLLIAATLATTAMAYCPNGCSGHGTCQTNPKVSLPLLHPTSLTPNASIEAFLKQEYMDQRKRPNRTERSTQVCPTAAPHTRRRTPSTCPPCVGIQYLVRILATTFSWHFSFSTQINNNTTNSFIEPE